MYTNRSFGVIFTNNCGYDDDDDEER